MADSAQKFSMTKRVKSFSHAWRGVRIFFKTTHNAWVQAVAFLIVLALSFYFEISPIEWLFVVLAAGFVFVTEALNTAIEIDMNLTSPEYHPFAQDTKDVAAGAVLMSASFSLIIGLIIFLPRIINLFA